MTRLIAAGLSYHTAPLAVREQAVVAGREGAQLLRYLVGHAGLSGAAVLSTCNRTEFYVTCPNDEVADQVLPRLGRYLDPSDDNGIPELMSASSDIEAVRHMFRVAAGLESMVVGEAQVLGQFKSAHQLALRSGTLDERLGYVLRRAISVGKRVRSETDIGRGVGSLSEAAVLWATSRLGPLAGRGVLLVGAGKMSTLAARRLRDLGAQLFVTSREGQSSVALAAALGGTPLRGDRLEDVATVVDVVLCSTDSPSIVISRADVEAFQSRRRHRPLCVLDIAVPRDVDPAASGVPGVELVDVDELGTHVAARLDGRRTAIPEALRIIESELRRTVAAIGERDATGPTIAALTKHADALRRAELARTMERFPDLDEAGRAHIDRLTRSLVSKLLHGPISHLRQNSDDLGVVLTLRDAFDLDGEPGQGGGGRRRPPRAPGDRAELIAPEEG